jgi:small GTP-binding protein
MNDALGDTKPVKVVMLGTRSVGKTTLVERWCTGRFDGTIGATYDVGRAQKPIEYNGVTYCLEIWDTAGQEQFSEIVPMYCRDCVGAMIVFDLESLSSFAAIPHWVNILHRHDKDIPWVLVGNKLDLSRAVSYRQVDELLAEYPGVELIQTSAKVGYFVGDAFSELARISLEYWLSPTAATTEPNHRVDIPDPNAGTSSQTKRACC